MSVSVSCCSPWSRFYERLVIKSLAINPGGLKWNPSASLIVDHFRTKNSVFIYCNSSAGLVIFGITTKIMGIKTVQIYSQPS